MPSFPLIVRGLDITQRAGQSDEVHFDDGVLPLSVPFANPPFHRVRNFRLFCNFRVPPVSGAWEAILDSGAPLSLIPRRRWRDEFRWRDGVHYDVCEFAGLGPLLDAQLLNASYHCRIVRLKVPVEISGPHPRDPRFRVENLIAQLPETDHPRLTVFGLWGGVFEGRQLHVDRRPNSDDLAARMVW
jgi:hypothetical protein